MYKSIVTEEEKAPLPDSIYSNIGQEKMTKIA